MLTIAIPTFRRNAILYRTVERILSQIDDRTKLLILDNSSPAPVAETLEPLIAGRTDVVVMRNLANVGSCANILRCFECAQSSHVWVLGDDDFIADDALDSIHKFIESNPEVDFFHFSSPWGLRESDVIAAGAHDYLEKFGTYDNLFFLSAGVYRAEPMQKNLVYGYTYSYSLLPHLAVLLMALGTNGKVLISSYRLIIEDPEEKPLEQGWSQVDLMLGEMTILELPLEQRTRELLAKLFVDRPSIELIVVHFLRKCVAEGTTIPHAFLFDQICSRVYYHAAWKTRLKIPLYRFLIRNPNFGLKVAELVGRNLKKPGFDGKPVIVWDRFVRM